MNWLTDWLGWRKERQLLKERLESAENRVKYMGREATITYQTLKMYHQELQLAHAALRRKGKALKMLHKQRHTKGGGRMEQQARKLLYDLTHVDNDWKCCVDRPDADEQIAKALRAAYTDGLEAAARILDNMDGETYNLSRQLLDDSGKTLTVAAKRIRQQAQDACFATKETRDE